TERPPCCSVSSSCYSPRTARGTGASTPCSREGSRRLDRRIHERSTRAPAVQRTSARRERLSSRAPPMEVAPRLACLAANRDGCRAAHRVGGTGIGGAEEDIDLLPVARIPEQRLDVQAVSVRRRAETVRGVPEADRRGRRSQ